jgi:hypothetical protein
MLSRWRHRGIRAAVVLVGVSLMGFLGCDLSAPQTYPVMGKVEFVGRDMRQLAGGHVEAALVGDLSIQASGEIQEDGSFTLEMIYDGKALSGARPGEYQARIVLSDEDRGSRRRRGRVVAPRFAQFKTSGLSFQVPTSGPVTLKVSPR